MSLSLPEGWEEVSLENVVDILDSQRKPINNKERANRIAGKDDSDLYPYYGATGNTGFIDDFIFDEELVLLGEDGVPFFDPFKHKAYIINGKTWVNNHAHVLRAKDEITINSYLTYFLNSFDYHGYVNGATRLKLNQSNMKKIPFLLPPLTEQKQIAKKLDKLLARVERIKTVLDNAPAKIKRFRQSVLASAVGGEFSEGKDWRVSTFSELGELARGKSKHRPRNDVRLFGNEYPFIQTGAIAQSSGKITTHSKSYSKFGLEQSRLFPIDTLCITIAANIADTAFLTYPACFPDSVVGFIADESKCEKEFIKYFIDTNKDTLESFAPATAQKNINLGILRKLEIPLPPLKEQKAIVKKVETLFAIADKMEANIAEAQKRVDKLTQSILAKAFRGEL